METSTQSTAMLYPDHECCRHQGYADLDSRSENERSKEVSHRVLSCLNDLLLTLFSLVVAVSSTWTVVGVKLMTSMI